MFYLNQESNSSFTTIVTIYWRSVKHNRVLRLDTCKLKFKASQLLLFLETSSLTHIAYHCLLRKYTNIFLVSSCILHDYSVVSIGNVLLAVNILQHLLFYFLEIKKLLSFFPAFLNRTAFQWFIIIIVIIIIFLTFYTVGHTYQGSPRWTVLHCLHPAAFRDLDQIVGLPGYVCMVGVRYVWYT